MPAAGELIIGRGPPQPVLKLDAGRVDNVKGVTRCFGVCGIGLTGAACRGYSTGGVTPEGQWPMANVGLEQQLQVRVADDAMRAVLSVPPGCDPDQFTEDLAVSLFRAAGIPAREALLKSIRAAVNRFQAEPDIEAVIVCRGQKPVAGTDARLEWVEGFDPTRTRTRGDDDAPPAPVDGERARVDYYNQVSYVAVEADDHVATMIPATPGEQGHDVRGNVLPTTPGNELTSRIDDTIALGADGKLIAKNDGVLRYHDNEVLVSPSLIVDDYVDFGSGNVEFDGDVEIRRGVRDRFTVRATGKILIEGLIEAATIESGGNFEARTGMAAKETGYVRIGGSLTAKYLECVNGTVAKDIIVHRGLQHCQLDVGGEVHIESGAVQGGTLRVAGAAHIGNLGSPSGDKTRIVLGYAHSIQAHLALTDQYLEDAEQTRDELAQELKMLQDAKADRLPSQRKVMADMTSRIPTLESKITRVRQKRAWLSEHLERVRKVDLTVEKLIEPGTMVVVGELGHIFDDPVKGPLRIARNAAREVVIKIGRDGAPTPIAEMTRSKIAPSTTFSAADLRGGLT